MGTSATGKWGRSPVSPFFGIVSNPIFPPAQSAAKTLNLLFDCSHDEDL